MTCVIVRKDQFLTPWVSSSLLQEAHDMVSFNTSDPKKEKSWVSVICADYPCCLVMGTTQDETASNHQYQLQAILWVTIKISGGKVCVEQVQNLGDKDWCLGGKIDVDVLCVSWDVNTMWN